MIEFKSPAVRRLLVLLYILSPESFPFLSDNARSALGGACITYVLASTIWQPIRRRLDRPTPEASKPNI